MPKQVAVILGVQVFEDPSVTELACATNDALALGRSFREIGFDRVTVLADGGDAAPTYLNAKRSIQDCGKLLRADDTFVLAVASHGVEKADRRYILTRETPADDPSRGIPLVELRDWLGRFECERLLLLLDICRSDPDAARAMADNLMTDPMSRDIVALAARKQAGRPEPTTAILSACGPGQRAYEWTTMGHGLFSYYLLEGVRDRVRTGEEVEIKALADYVRTQVEAWCDKDEHRRHRPQTPSLELAGPARRIALGRRMTAPQPEHAVNDGPPQPQPRPVKVVSSPRLRITTLPSGAELEVDGLVCGLSPQALPLKAGRHRVVARLAGYEEGVCRIEFGGVEDEELRVELKARPKLVQAFFPMTEAEAKEVQRAAAEVLGRRVYEELDVGGSVKMKFALIPAGKFLMGSPVGEEGRRDDEGQHEVTLAKSFGMGVYAVTQEQYEIVMGNNPSNFKGRPKPVEQVNWDYATKFCQTFGMRVGRSCRLPTEAEWEYACRAGTLTPFHMFQITTEQANCDGNAVSGSKGVSREKTMPVGSFKPNAWGLYDMHGNVSEWCADWYSDYPTWPEEDPNGPASGTDRVLRGGSWVHHPWSCRSACRDRIAPLLWSNKLGFRLAMDIP